MSLISVYDKSPVVIWFSDKNESKIITENMDLAGDLIHSLANFLNIEDLKVSEKKKTKIKIQSSQKFPLKNKPVCSILKTRRQRPAFPT